MPSISSGAPKGDDADGSVDSIEFQTSSPRQNVWNTLKRFAILLDWANMNFNLCLVCWRVAFGSNGRRVHRGGYFLLLKGANDTKRLLSVGEDSGAERGGRSRRQMDGRRSSGQQSSRRPRRLALTFKSVSDSVRCVNFNLPCLYSWE